MYFDYIRVIELYIYVKVINQERAPSKRCPFCYFYRINPGKFILLKYKETYCCS